jgi:hypothetical protein
MSQRNLILPLRAQGNSATAMRQHLIEAFSGLVISCAMVSTTIRSLSWHPIDDESQNLGGLPQLNRLRPEYYISLTMILGLQSVRLLTQPVLLCRRCGTFSQCSSGIHGENPVIDRTLSAIPNINSDSSRVSSF